MLITFPKFPFHLRLTNRLQFRKPQKHFLVECFGRISGNLNALLFHSLCFLLSVSLFLSLVFVPKNEKKNPHGSFDISKQASWPVDWLQDVCSVILHSNVRDHYSCTENGSVRRDNMWIPLSRTSSLTDSLSRKCGRVSSSTTTKLSGCWEVRGVSYRYGTPRTTGNFT